MSLWVATVDAGWSGPIANHAIGHAAKLMAGMAKHLFGFTWPPMREPVPAYPSRVSTFRVICSTCGSRPASPCAQSVDPDVTTVAPAVFVYAPSTAWP